MIKEAGPPCPTCAFPVFTEPFKAGEAVKCPACGKESELSTSLGSLSETIARDLALALGAGALLLLIFTKAGKGNIRVR